MFYHVWFSPTRRKWVLQGDVERAVKELLMETARRKGLKLLACETMVDHVHLLLDLDERQDLSKVIKDLKGPTARAVFQRFPDLYMDARLQHLWQRGYGCREVPPEEVERVAGYIRSQHQRPEKYDRT